MSQLLQEWSIENQPGDDMKWKVGFWDQISFVREPLAACLARQDDHTYEELPLVRVIGTHTSKSILLPVYEIDWKRGVRFTLEYNFHFWTVSVESKGRDCPWAFDGLFKRDKNADYFYGIPHDMRFGSWAKDPRRFSFSVGTKFDVYAFALLMTQLYPAADAGGKESQ